MLGSLSFYRRVLRETVFANPIVRSRFQTRGEAVAKSKPQLGLDPLPALGHGVAGIFAGLTVGIAGCPVELIKNRLQLQYAVDRRDRFYSGPIDCTKKILRSHGIRGLYHGLSATLIYRCFFFFWWSSYDIITRLLKDKTPLSTPAINFWAGALSSQAFWLTAYPADVVKQRKMLDPLGGTHGDGTRMFHRWRDAAVAVGRESGFRGYWRGFVPCFLRAFPANGLALVAFEGVMRALP